jgi:hypothetical protein
MEYITIMKIKCTFTEEDFSGSGQMLIRNSAPLGCKDYGFMSTVSYKIGYMPNPHPNGVGQWSCMISLADGMIIPYESMDALIEGVNNDYHGFRPMSQEEIRQVMEYTSNRMSFSMFG